MKALFSKAKLGKLRNFLSLLLIMGCYVIYQRFLVVAYYDIGLFIVVTVVAVLYDKLIASKGFDAIVNTRVRDKKRLLKVGNLVKNSYLYR